MFCVSGGCRALVDKLPNSVRSVIGHGLHTAGNARDGCGFVVLGADRVGIRENKMGHALRVLNRIHESRGATCEDADKHESIEPGMCDYCVKLVKAGVDRIIDTR